MTNQKYRNKSILIDVTFKLHPNDVGDSTTVVQLLEGDTDFNMLDSEFFQALAYWLDRCGDAGASIELIVEKLKSEVDRFEKRIAGLPHIREEK